MDNMKKIDELLAFYEAHMPERSALVKRKERFDEVKQAIQEIADFVWSIAPNANIVTKTDSLIGSSMCLEITSSLIVIEEIDKFCKAIKKADNFEIYSGTDGNVAFNIVFHDVYEPAPPAEKK